MKTVLRNSALAVVFSFSLLSSSGAAETKKPQQPVQTTKEPGTSEMKWKPTGEPWVACVRNGMQCRCSGDVVDCRAATGGKKVVKAQ